MSKTILSRTLFAKRQQRAAVPTCRRGHALTAPSRYQRSASGARFCLQCLKQRFPSSTKATRAARQRQRARERARVAVQPATAALLEAIKAATAAMATNAPSAVQPAVPIFPAPATTPATSLWHRFANTLSGCLLL